MKTTPILTALAIFASSTAMAAAGPTTVTPQTATLYQNLTKQPAVTKALANIKADDDWALAEMKTINAIPAPPFKEQARAAHLLTRFKELGLKDAYIDKEGNVLGVYKGANPNGPLLVVSAHIDTVFPEGTDVVVKERDGKLHAPGIGDNTRGIVTLLAVIKAVHENKIKTAGSVMFAANVGEEGEGDLRGVKAIFRDHANIAGFISIDSGDLENDVINQATGSHRYEAIFTGPGGHSFAAFGKVPSAIHAMGRAIAKIADLQTPADPKTTFTVGVVTGGASINSIAGEARMKLDMRSNGKEELLAVEKEAMAAIHAAVDEENRRWNTQAKIAVELKPLGVRPAGLVPADSLIVQAAAASLNALGMSLKALSAASTDSNVGISLGIPSLTIGKGGISGAGHSLTEWYEHKDAYKGAQNALLLMLGLVGMDGAGKPLLEARK
ncbi:MAG: M20/M25/M40 family metallo-hydrolase [Deltaproteobacteria bacterium]|nr:M20/M25/M40 family metallo-hydrolase [Deltaproteobacteria bacterium]